jgi:hypothetical protein
MAPLECREKWIPGLRLPAHPGMTKREWGALNPPTHTFAFSPHHPRESCENSRPRKQRGRRECRRVRRARSLACKNRKHASKSPRLRRNTRHSLHNGFNGFFRDLLGEPGFLATVTGVMRSIIGRLDISVGISGPHDFAVRATRLRQKALPGKGAARLRHLRVHRLPRPTSVTIAKRPS